MMPLNQGGRYLKIFAINRPNLISSQGKRCETQFIILWGNMKVFIMYYVRQVEPTITTMHLFDIGTKLH